MNKFQKIALQMTKDQLKNGVIVHSRYSFNELKNHNYKIVSNTEKDNVKKALELKNFFKKITY